MARQDAGIQYRDHHACALRQIPCSRCIDAAIGVAQVPLVLGVQRVVGNQLRAHVGGRNALADVDRAQHAVDLHVGHGWVVLELDHHLVHLRGGQRARQLDQVRADAQLAHIRGLGGGSAAARASTDANAAHRGLHGAQLAAAIGRSGGAVLVAHDQPATERCAGRGCLGRFLDQQFGGGSQRARRTEGHHQDGAGQRVETEILVDHGEVLFVFFVNQAWRSRRNRCVAAVRCAASLPATPGTAITPCESVGRPSHGPCPPPRALQIATAHLAPPRLMR